MESVQLKIVERRNESQIIFHSNKYCLGDSVTSLRIDTIIKNKALFD